MPGTSPASPSPRSRLHLAGVLILVVGWLAAALVYFTAGGDSGAGGGNYQVVDGHVYQQSASKAQLQMTERMGGLATVRMAEFDDFLGSLWHGERLAFTLALLSTVVALACIHFAGLAAEEAD